MLNRILHGDDDAGYQEPEKTTVFYKVVASLVFAFMSFNLFFPFNSIFPLDRRTASAIAGTLCYFTRAFLFPDQPMDLVEAVDWDVIILLAGIMCINYIVVNQKETKNVVDYVQDQIKNAPKNGFWLVNTSAFLVSPFLTNDGVCLLFVEPILAAFEGVAGLNSSSHGSANGSMNGSGSGKGSGRGDSRHGSNHGEESFDLQDPNAFVLERADAIYFLLGLACSSNIGSSLTYTGNPQVRSQFPPHCFSFDLNSVSLRI
jgi:di/tricarboxylate transporter